MAFKNFDPCGKKQKAVGLLSGAFIWIWRIY